ncbi:MAG: hypothetical protein IMF09_08020 [Proteobacteria bacterium]|nr:hypothetical protein [Pseudomonadota bacterium]
MRQLRATNSGFTDPLTLDFDGFKLKPSQEHDYHLVTGINFVGYADMQGQLEVDLSETMSRFTMLAVLVFLGSAACSPTVKVRAPDYPMLSGLVAILQLKKPCWEIIFELQAGPGGKNNISCRMLD